MQFLTPEPRVALPSLPQVPGLACGCRKGNRGGGFGMHRHKLREGETSVGRRGGAAHTVLPERNSGASDDKVSGPFARLAKPDEPETGLLIKVKGSAAGYKHARRIIEAH